MSEKPKSNSASEKELDKAQKNFQEFDNSLKEMTMDRMNQAPRLEVEPQTRLSQNEIARSKEIYLKPKRTISAKGDKYSTDPKLESERKFDQELVRFIAEHREIIGETIDVWTKPHAGIPAEEWDVPTGKPVWGPRYLPKQIKKCSYHRFVMTDQATEHTGVGTMYGSMAVDNTVQRLDATPVSNKTVTFMGAEGF